jgi:hypothetical protein
VSFGHYENFTYRPWAFHPHCAAVILTHHDRFVRDHLRDNPDDCAIVVEGRTTGQHWAIGRPRDLAKLYADFSA